MPSSNAAVPTFSFRELTIWRTKLPHVQFAVLPPSNTRPNPLVANDKLFVSVFAPGAVCALGRATGKLLWSRRLSGLGAASVYRYQGRLFAKSSHTLHSLRPESGKVLWEFCPYGTKHETMYSSPTGYQGRIYVGDREGFLHCLDAATGRSLWKLRTSRARNNDVNSTPLVANGSVMVTTNAKSAIACDPVTGRLKWSQRLDAPSIFGPVLWRGLVVAVASSVCLLDADSGEVRRRIKFGNESARFVECTPGSVIAAFTGGGPPCGSSNLVLLGKSGTERKASIAGYCMCFRYSAEKRLLYSSHIRGIDILHPDTAEVLGRLKAPGDARGGMALVDVKGGTIYALAGSGHVYALRHPPIP